MAEKPITADLPKNIPILAKLLENSIASIFFTESGSNKLNQCICTLSKGLIEFYIKNLKVNQLSESDINDLFRTTYQKNSNIIFVYDLIEGRKISLYLGNKDWYVQNCIILTEANKDKIIEFINVTWPEKTSEVIKRKTRKLKK